jgi:DNA-binding transcriptional LysR family regulator
MELRQLRYFVTVARTRHFGQAAERLHMAQSPLSQAIRQLESQLGVTLFERTTRRVDLTPAGEALLADAERILASVSDAGARARRIGEGHAGLLRVGATGLTALAQLPRLARIAARELPDLQLRYVPGLLTPAQELALTEDRIDLAVLRPPLREPGLASRLVTSERLVVAVPANHRLAGDEPAALAELRDEDFVRYGTEGSVVDTVVGQACLNVGFLPRLAGEGSDNAILLTQVAAGIGVAVLPCSVRALRVDGVRYVPLADDVHIDVALAWRAGDAGSAHTTALPRLLTALEAGGFLPPMVAPQLTGELR